MDKMKIPTVLDYIHDQPRALRETLLRKEEFLVAFDKVFKEDRVRKIHLFGSGTSYNVSVIAAYYFKHIAGIDAQANYPTVFKNYEKADWTGLLSSEEILYIGISQSGTSISTVSMMEVGKKNKYRTVALTEDLESEITRHVDSVIHLLCGKELNPPETRGFTVAVLQMYLIAWRAALLNGNKTMVEYNDAMNDAEKLVANFDLAISEAERWYDRNATTLVSSERVCILGYGVDFGSALEGQLKIGEMLRIPSIGYELEEFSHGPTMAITGKQTILLFGSDEPEWERCKVFRDAFKKYTTRVHLITYKKIESDYRDCIFSLQTTKYLAPILYTLPIQFTAAKGALDTNIDTAIDPFKIPLAHMQ